jgi:hypothetical protein
MTQPLASASFQMNIKHTLIDIKERGTELRTSTIECFLKEGHDAVDKFHTMLKNNKLHPARCLK